MLQLIKPKFFMPVHGEYKMLKQHMDTAIETGIPKENIFTCANGDVLLLRNEQVYQSSIRIQADDIYVDGNDISGVSTAVLKDRKILADNGLVSVIVCIDSRMNKIMCRPVIVSRGFVFIKDSQTLLKEAENVVYTALRERMATKTTFGEIKNTIRSSLEPFLYNKTHRNPIVIPVILNSKEAMTYLAEGEKGVGALMPRKSALDALLEKEGVCDALKEVAVLLKEADLQSFPMSGYVNEYLGAIGNNMTAYMEGTMDMDTAVSNIQEEVQAAADAFNGK